MRKIHRKLVGSAVLCVCTWGASRAAEIAENVFTSVLITGEEAVLPIIILDPGYGTLTLV